MQIDELLFEYYLTGGKLRIGKKEAMLELLRNGSALRFLLGYEAGYLTPMIVSAMKSEYSGEYVILDLSNNGERKLKGDPTPAVKDLKERLGDATGGTLYFRVLYKTTNTYIYLVGDLEAGTVRQQ